MASKIPGVAQADDGLRACASSMLSHGPVAVPSSGAVPGTAPLVPCGMELLSVSGQVLIPAPAGAGGPAIPASGPWLAAHLAGPLTVPGSGNSVGHPGNLGGHETWEDARSWRHRRSTRMSCANAR
jgi:hypothetical protein